MSNSVARAARESGLTELRLCHCGQNRVRAAGQSSCRVCHAAYMRRTRPKHSEQSEEAQVRHRARRLARGAARRGTLPMTPCPCRCGSLLLEMHHEDYTKPLDVVWTCPTYHQVLDNRRAERLKAEARDRADSTGNIPAERASLPA